jgi:hypothetical protein
MKKRLLILFLLFAGTAHGQSSASGNFGANVGFAGPNPYYDLTLYGLYTGGGAPITCSITSRTHTLRCGRGIGDFAVGQGIEIPLAGPASTFAPWGTTTFGSHSRTGNVATFTTSSTVVGPPQTITISCTSNTSYNVTGATITSLTNSGLITVANTGSNASSAADTCTGTLTSPSVVVTPSGVLNGTTTYAYKVVMRDYNGALSAASPAGTTTTGAATLGNNTATASGCTRISGIVTCTTTSAHNMQVGATVTLVGTSNPAHYDGAHQVYSTPSTTTFTFTAYDQPDDANPPTGGTANYIAKNTVQWNMQQNIQLQAFIYRCTNGGAYSLVGITEGMDGAFVDWGAQSLPGGRYVGAQASYISTGTPTASAVNGILAGRITGISGTTLTLDTAATATATSQPAAHDNAPIIVAGCTALGAGGSGNLYIPNGGSVVFNSILNMRDKCTFPNPDKMKILVNSATLVVNEPIVLRQTANDWESIGGGGPLGSFTVGQPTSAVNGNAYPIFYMPTGEGPNYFKNFLISSYNLYQSGMVEDQNASGGGTTNTEYDNVYFGGYIGSMPMILRGGAFFHRFERGEFDGGSAYAAPEPLLITYPHPLGVAGANFSFGGDMTFNQTVFAGKGALFESWGGTAQVGYITFTDNLMESGFSPLLRFNLGPGSDVIGMTLTNPAFSDSPLPANPMVETGGSPTQSAGFINFHVFNPQCSGPLFAGSGSGNVEIEGNCAPNLPGATGYTLHGWGGSNTTLIKNGGVAINGGSFYTLMAQPAPPTLATSTTGGSVTNGPHWYAIVAVDALNNPTIPSSQVFITTTGTNRSTVTLTPPTLPAGAVGYRVYRFDSTSSNFYGVLDICAQLATPINGVFVDTIPTGTECGNSSPSINTAGTSILSSSGFYGPSVTIFPTVFANLGTPANGTLYFCPDCTVANPCAGAGTGALAKRLNGVWVCN